jgi:hypothetical protein
MSKDYKFYLETSESIIYLAMINVLMHRLAAAQTTQLSKLLLRPLRAYPVFPEELEAELPWSDSPEEGSMMNTRGP